MSDTQTPDTGAVDEARAVALTDAVMAAQPSSAPPDYVLDCAKAIADHDPYLRSMCPPCKLTPTVAVRLLMAIRQGAHYETACAKARISYSTFVSWRNRAEDEPEDGAFASLMLAVKLAEADAELESIADVRVAAKNPKCWAAGMTFLERRHPDRWRRKDETAVNVNVGVVLGLQASDEQRRAIVPRIVTQALSPASETSSALSLSAPIAVSGDLT